MWYSKKIFANTDISKQELNIPVSASLQNILKDLQSKNWRGLIVGGAVRDAVTGQIPKDVDVEVYGPNFDQLAEVLKNHGSILGASSQTDESQVIGKAFGVIKFKDSEGNDYDFSLPRRDSKTGVGHTGFDIQVDPNMSPKEAASRRDFTINSLAYDPLTQELHDYFGGKDDLQNKILRATDVEKFGEDPLRVLRGMQLISRIGSKRCKKCKCPMEMKDVNQ
jgi:tRNA nucleotidyltransferase (CCA-adding enzyme)